MNRAGFSLLAMGFTGTKAMRWKLGYIQAFNGVEDELRSRRAKTKSSASLPDARLA
jgi:phage regulator Rha-like protein